MRIFFAACFAIACCACSSAPASRTTDQTASGVAANPLVTSLEIEVGADTVHLVLHVTNSASRPALLEFRTAQRYDFEVRTAAGAEVWRWSSGRLFAQVLGSETIPPGASREYREAWASGTAAGDFVAIGRVVASNMRIEQRARFEISEK